MSMKKAMESLRSGIAASIPASVICCRIYDVLEALDGRTLALETDIKDARDHYGDAFGEVELQFRYMESRLGKIEERLDALEQSHGPTCGECVHPWHKRVGDIVFLLACHHSTGDFTETAVWRKEDEAACENFKRREVQ